jgi:hypothetical protein
VVVKNQIRSDKEMRYWRYFFQNASEWICEFDRSKREMQKAFFLGQSARSEEADDIGKKQKSRLLTSLKASVEFGIRPALTRRLRNQDFSHRKMTSRSRHSKEAHNCLPY